MKTTSGFILNQYLIRHVIKNKYKNDWTLVPPVCYYFREQSLSSVLTGDLVFKCNIFRDLN